MASALELNVRYYSSLGKLTVSIFPIWRVRVRTNRRAHRPRAVDRRRRTAPGLAEPRGKPCDAGGGPNG